MVAGGAGDDTVRSFLRSQGTDLVVGAADLESAGELQVLRLDVNVFAQPIGIFQRSLAGNALQRLLGFLDVYKRQPMQWSSDASAEGMCKGPDGMESIKMTNGSLEDQQDDPDSIYNYFKQAIRLRNRYPEIARGIAANVENLSDKNLSLIHI